MKKKRNNRFSLLLSTALIVALGMMAYYYYTSQVKTKRVNKQAYHLLYRKANDVRALELAFTRIAQTKKIQLHWALDSILKKASDKSIDKLYELSDDELESLINKTLVASGTNYKHFEISYDYPTVDSIRFEEQITFASKTIDSDYFGVNYKISKQVVLDGLNLKRTFFDEFAFVSDSNQIYLSTKKELSNLDFYDASHQHLAEILAQDSTFSSSNIINRKENQTEVNIRGINYQTFLVPIKNDNTQGFTYIIGFIKSSTYKNMCRGLDYQLSISIFFTIFFILLSIPLIRLLVVSPGEPYGMKNTIVLFFNICVLVFLVAFGLIRQSNIIHLNKGILHVDQNKAATREDHGELKQISDSIKYQFNTELDSIVKSAGILSKKPFITRNEVEITLEDLLSGKTIQSSSLDSNSYRSRNDYQPYPFLQAELVADTKAVVQLINTTGSGTRAGVSINYRDYYQHPDKYQLQDSEKFGFESIFDMASGIPEAAISVRRNNSDSISAITTHLYSVNHTVLPEGYSFCIIDLNGKVWFHKDRFNNSRENFLEEITRREQIEEALLSRAEKSLMLDYKLTPQYVHVQPIRPEMVLFLVTFCSKKMYDKNGSYLSTMVFTTTLLFVILFLFVCLSGLYVLQVFNQEKNALNRKGLQRFRSLLLSYFPNQYNTPIYLRLSVTNFLLFALLLVLYLNKGYVQLDLTGMFIYLLLASISAAYWNLFYQLPDVNFRPVVFWRISVIGVIPFVLSWMPFMNPVFENAGTKEQFSYIVFTLLLNAGFYGCMELLAWWSSSTKWEAWDKLGKFLLNHWAYVYVTRYFTVLLLSVFLPLFAFYVFYYHQESIIFRNKQLNHFVTEHQTRNQTLAANYLFPGIEEKSMRDALDKRTRHFTERQKKGIYFPSRFSYNLDTVPSLPFIRHGTLSAYINQFGHLRTHYHNLRDKIEYGVSRTPQNFATAADNQLRYSGYSANNDSMYLVKTNYKDSVKDIEGNTTRARIKRTIAPLSNKVVCIGFPLILLFTGFIFIRFIPEILKFLFPALRFNNEFVKQYRRLNRLNGIKPKNTYYITMPDEALITERFGNEYVHPIEMLDATELFKQTVSSTGYSRKNVFVCFHYFTQPSLVQLQLFNQQINELFKQSNIASVNIVAFFTPLAMVEHLRELNNEDTEWIEAVAEFSKLLYSMHAFYIPVNQQMLVEGKNGNAFLQKNEQLISSINAEIEKTNDAANFSREEYTTYSVAYPYYQRIWSNCTNIEKSVLFDIADDHVINLHNKKEIGLLMNKGLIVSGAYLQLFEGSFERFVLKQKEEIKEINRELREQYQGGWSVIRIPILIVSASVLLFLVITQQNILTNIQSVLISVGTIVTLGLRFVELPFKSVSKP